MAEYPDGYFDLAVVDPPYGINIANDDRFGKTLNKAATMTKNYSKKDWDNLPPTNDYFIELKRISKKQIIWGANYYDFNLKGAIIVWDKCVPENYTKSKCEIAYKSWGNSVALIKFMWHGMLQQNMKNKENRIHPTQKPQGLYDKIYFKYVSKNFKIIDTHLGSGSHLLTADKFGVAEFVGCELDKEYFDAMKKRYELYKSQKTINF